MKLPARPCWSNNFSARSTEIRYREIESIRGDLTLVEKWANAAHRDPDGFTRASKKLIEMNRYQLLRELQAAQLSTFNPN